MVGELGVAAIQNIPPNTSILVVYYANTYANHTIQIYKRLCCSDTNVLLISNFFSSTRGERQFLKIFRNHTMLTTLTNVRHISWSNFNFSTSWSDPNFSISLSDPTSHHHCRTPTSTVCHWGRQPNCLSTWPKVNSQLTLFQNLQFLRALSSGHDVIHTAAPFPIWGLLWQLCYKRVAEGQPC